jgi:hypothetical protein
MWNVEKPGFWDLRLVDVDEKLDGGSLTLRW